METQDIQRTRDVISFLIILTTGLFLL
jgi:hypothetical protein